MSVTPLARLACVGCGYAMDVPPAVIRCARCDEALLVTAGPTTVALAPGRTGDGIWRFASALPAVPVHDRTSLGEGDTPLLSGAVQGIDLWVKNEAVAPTASYKDRFNAVNVSVARTLGFRGMTLASTGNAGLSAAAYGARAGLAVRVYCPEESPPAIRAAIRALGGRVEVCASAEARVRVAADVREGFFPGSRAVPADNGTPFGCEGYKTISYEIVGALGRAPVEVYVPVGGGDGVYGIHRGFEDLVHSGLIDRVPRLVGVRTRSPAALSIAGDEVGEHAVRAVSASGGQLRLVSHAQIVAAVGELAQLGIHAEPASAAAVAGLLASRGSGRAGDAVCVVTGSGLKWPDLKASDAACRRPLGVLTESEGGPE